MNPVKTMEQIINEKMLPINIEREAKYQNARDAVAWAWKIAQDKVSIAEDTLIEREDGRQRYDTRELSATEFAHKIGQFADELIPIIESNLNDTLEALKEPNGAKS